MANNIYQPLGEKAWLAQLQKGSGRKHCQRGTGLGSVFGHLLRTVDPIKNTPGRQQSLDSTTVVKKKKKRKSTPKRQQTGKGLGVRPRKQMQKARGPLKVIKRITTAKKKSSQRGKKKKKTFALFK